MHNAKSTAGALAGLAVALMIAGGWLWTLTRRAEAELAGLSARVAWERETLDQWKHQVETARLARGRVNPAVVASSAPAPSAPARHGISSQLVFETFLKSPKLLAEYLNLLRANLPAMYGPFLRSRGLSADQISRLQGLIVQREAQVLDIAAASPAVGAALRQIGSPNPTMIPSLGVADQMQSPRADLRDPAAEELLRQNSATFNADAQALLGPDNVSALQDYERTLPVRPFAAKVAGALASGGDALSLAQADRLTVVLANATTGYPKGQLASPSDLDWGQAVTQAAGFLTAAQLHMLQVANQGVIANREFNQVLSQAVGKPQTP